MLRFWNRQCFFNPTPPPPHPYPCWGEHPYEKVGKAIQDNWIKPLKETNLGVVYQPLLRQGALTRRLYSRVGEIEIRALFYYYFFACTLKDTLTAKIVAFHHLHPKWDQNPWLCPKQRQIASLTFSYGSHCRDLPVISLHKMDYFMNVLQ